LVTIDDGFREIKESWQGLLLDIKSRGLIHSPALAVGDGALEAQFLGSSNRRISHYGTSTLLGT
jgi:hypothetical protein